MSLEDKAKEYWDTVDQKITDILSPIESRMYAIQINHAVWLRENNLHLVKTGRGHETHAAILEFAKDIYRQALKDMIDRAEELQLPYIRMYKIIAEELSK